MNYDNMKKEYGVAFGQEILTTAIKSMHHGINQYYELYQCNTGFSNPVSTIKYNLPVAGNVLLTVCALDGRTLSTLFSGRQEAGRYEVPWDTRKLSPGFYLYRLQSGRFSATRKARVINY